MKRRAVPLIAAVFMILTVSCSGPRFEHSATQQSTRETFTLTKDTKLPLSATVSHVFKAGTRVTTDGMRYVVKGTLASDANLSINYRPDYVRFKAGAPITFKTTLLNNIRPVLVGTLANDTALSINYRPSHVTFKRGTQVTFSETILSHIPAVVSGTPLANTRFSTNYVPSYVLFKGGAPITLTMRIQNHINIIHSGTLAEDTYLYVNYSRTERFRAGTRVTFTGNLMNNINPVQR